MPFGEYNCLEAAMQSEIYNKRYNIIVVFEIGKTISRMILIVKYLQCQKCILTVNDQLFENIVS